MITLRWEGVNQAAAMLRQLPRMIAEELLEKAVLAGADLIAIEAQGRIPRPGLRRRPGTKRLSDSMRVEVQSKSRAHARVIVGSKSPYAHLVEYGHQIIARGPSRRGKLISVTNVGATGRVTTKAVTEFTDAQRRQFRADLTLRRAKGPIGFVAPRPFLRPAFDEQRERVMQMMAQVIRTGVQHWISQQPVMRKAA